MLKRYNVGFAIDEDEDGLWVKWSDVEDDADILHSRIAQLEAALRRNIEYILLDSETPPWVADDMKLLGSSAETKGERNAG